jgi:sulfite exporter TauE/SafE
MMELTWISALAMGFFGSTHCIGMCGGVTAALTLSLPPATRAAPLRLFPYLLGYNGGRIASYALAGALAGFLGQQFTGLLPVLKNYPISLWLSAAFMIAVGLYLGDWWRGLAWLERGGAKLWQRIEPLGRRFLPPRNPLHALALGMVWGWLPCGLVYAALASALAAGGATAGAWHMLAFGAGTLPMLLAMGAAAQWLSGLARRPLVRQIGAVLLIGFGLFLVWQSTQRHNHNHAQSAMPETHQHHGH